MVMFIQFLVFEKFHHFSRPPVFSPSFKIEKAPAVSNLYRNLPAIIIKIPVGIREIRLSL